ncbi:MAG: glycosyltransferase family 2 protein [Synechococcus sp. MIT S9220]|nr:glycosyltransferase family 2 protein [Synechococcus sp. MIT S9220]
MAAFNSSSFISYAIDSILSQTFTEFEFIIVDDGSTDSTLSILNSYAERDQRVRVYANSHNIGLTQSLNIAANLAQTPILVRQDSDDLSHPDRLSIQVSFISNGLFDMCSTRTLISSTNRVSGRIARFIPKSLLLLFTNPFIHGSLCFKKSAFDLLGGYNSTFVYAQDYDLIVRWLYYGFSIKYFHHCLYTSVDYPSSISNLHRHEQQKQALYSRNFWRKACFINPLLLFSCF